MRPFSPARYAANLLPRRQLSSVNRRARGAEARATPHPGGNGAGLTARMPSRLGSRSEDRPLRAIVRPALLRYATPATCSGGGRLTDKADAQSRCHRSGHHPHQAGYDSKLRHHPNLRRRLTSRTVTHRRQQSKRWSESNGVKKIGTRPADDTRKCGRGSSAADCMLQGMQPSDRARCRGNGRTIRRR